MSHWWTWWEESGSTVSGIDKWINRVDSRLRERVYWHVTDRARWWIRLFRRCFYWRGQHRTHTGRTYGRQAHPHTHRNIVLVVDIFTKWCFKRNLSQVSSHLTDKENVWGAAEIKSWLKKKKSCMYVWFTENNAAITCNRWRVNAFPVVHTSMCEPNFTGGHVGSWTFKWPQKTCRE